MASSVWQRSSSRKGPCWLDLQQLFDKLVPGDVAARCLEEKLICDVVSRTSRFFMVFSPLNSNSTFFVLFLHHHTWERAKGYGVKIPGFKLCCCSLTVEYPQEKSLDCTELQGSIPVKWRWWINLSCSVCLRIKQNIKWGNTCQITKRLTNYGSISFYTYI